MNRTTPKLVMKAVGLVKQGKVATLGKDDPEIGAYGLGPLGVEHVGQKGFLCRGAALDAVALRGGQLPIPTGAEGDPVAIH